MGPFNVKFSGGFTGWRQRAVSRETVPWDDGSVPLPIPCSLTLLLTELARAHRQPHSRAVESGLVPGTSAWTSLRC